MRKLKLLTLILGLSLTTLAFADVPVIDGYDNSQQARDNSQSQAVVPVQTGTSQANVSLQTDSANVTVQSAASNPSLPMNQRVTILERQVSNMSQMLMQYNNLQQQVQDLRGQLEVEKHTIKVLQDQARNQYQDLDQRLRANRPAAQPLNAPVASQTSANNDVDANPQPAAAATAPTNAVATRTATRAIRSTRSTQTNGVMPITTAAATSNASTPAAAAPSANANASDQLAYQGAFDLLKKKNYAKATVAFQNFVRKYPSSQYATNGRYWLGQLYLLQGQPDKAIMQFHVILRKDPANPKASDALLQLGLAYYAKGDLSRAELQLNKVQQKYPNTNAARMAQTRLQQIQSQLAASGVPANNTVSNVASGASASATTN